LPFEGHGEHGKAEWHAPRQARWGDEPDLPRLAEFAASRHPARFAMARPDGRRMRLFLLWGQPCANL